MAWFVAAIFCEFAVVALLAPNLGQFHRRIVAKVATALMVPLVITPGLLISARLFDTGIGLVEVLRLQLLACCFAVGLAGLATLIGRQWSWGGPVAVSVLGLAILASPFWGNLLLDLRFDSVRDVALRFLVAANPLFTVAREVRFDWTHADQLYVLTRIGEDFAYSPAALITVSFVYGAVGVAAAALAGLVRQRGRPAEYVGDSAHF